jgi:hypothetical protein
MIYFTLNLKIIKLLVQFLLASFYHQLFLFLPLHLRLPQEQLHIFIDQAKELQVLFKLYILDNFFFPLYTIESNIHTFQLPFNYLFQ